MPTRHGLFYVLRLGNRIHICFFVLLFLKLFIYWFIFIYSFIYSFLFIYLLYTVQPKTNYFQTNRFDPWMGFVCLFFIQWHINLGSFLNVKVTLKKNSSGTIWLIAGGEIRRFVPFLKVDVIARLEFELIHSDVAVQHASHNAIGATPIEFGSNDNEEVLNTSQIFRSSLMSYRWYPPLGGSYPSEGDTVVYSKPRKHSMNYTEGAPGFLAGPSGIRAGWVLETKSRLGAE